MSIELPEAKILGSQMKEVLVGKVVESYAVKDYERLIKIGFMNRNLDDYEDLLERRIESVDYRGNLILVRFDEGMNLLVGPEYGGLVSYREKGECPDYHLKLSFKDGSVLTVRLTSMGGVIAVDDEKLKDSYLYKRDFGDVLSPLDEDFTLERFAELMAERKRMLKSVLVGKDAVLVGISNATYQDVIYRAGLHPKRRASSLSPEEVEALYDAINHVIEERLRLGGKVKFRDLHGREGGYNASMGPHMKNEDCPKCGIKIESIQHGGGKVYLCPKCQSL